MSDKKISQLTSLAQGDIATTTDVLAIVDTSATETKKATPAAIVGAAAAAGLTNVDINSGAIDGTAIGANSASTGAFTTLSASSSVTLSGGTANGVLYLNGSKVATSGANLTYDGTTFTSVGQINVKNDLLLSDATAIQGRAYGDASGVVWRAESGLAQRWHIGSSEQMRLTSTGLGIGTSSPGDKIHAASATAAGLSLEATGAGGSTWRILSTDSAASIGGGYLGFNNGSYRMVLDTSGNLGIGTSSPAYKLHVTGTQRIEKSGAGYEAAMLSFSTLSETGAIYRMGMASGGAFIIGRSDTATTNLTLDVSGNLGIGTSSPAVPLDVVSNSGSNGINIRARSSNDYGFLNFKSNDGSDTAGSIAALRAGVNSGSLLFYTGTTEKARLDTSGNLGIGTSSPSYKLDVAGDARSNSWIGRANGSAPTADCAVFRPADNSLGFSTANTERARLDSSGNLGLGVTPSAWASGQPAIQIGSTGVQNRSTTISQFSTNQFWNGANHIYINSAAATLYTQNAGVHSWATAPSGTAGNAISFTQAMTLDANGVLFAGAVDSVSSGVRALFTGTVGSVPVVKIDGVTANGFTLLGDHYGADESIVTLGISYSSGSTIIGNTVAPSTSNDTGFISTQDTYACRGAAIRLDGGSGAISFWNSNTNSTVTTGSARTLTQAMTLDASGNLLVGTTGGDGRISIKPGVDSGALRVYDSGGTGRVYLLPDETYGYQYVSTIKTNGNYAMRIENSSATLVGGIVTNASSVSYNTTSDRRLKENIIEADDTGAIFDSIKIIKHDWKNGGHTRYGVIAQDLHAVVPEAVKVGDSNETVTDPWGVDYSKLVPMLVKEIQSLRARVAQLEAK